MSEEKLPEEENKKNPAAPQETSQDSNDLEKAMVEEASDAEEKKNTAEEKLVVEDAVEKADGKEEKTETIKAEKEEVSSEKSEDSDEDLDVVEEEHEEEEIASSDDNEEEEHEETTDYSELSKEELISEFKKILGSKTIPEMKNAVDEIRSEFNSKFNEEVEEKKEEFLAEGGNIIDFYYTTPLKKDFNSLYFDYKEKRNNYYKNLKKNLHENLKKREELIEELKGLLNMEENMNNTYNHFKDIQERWHTAGPIPRDKYNLIWNNYHHHVENFYDFLHLNREFRDLDFKHNLDQKLKLIGRAEELSQEEDVNKAFRELQMLHKMWKEDVGPVAKEYRDDVWNKFSEATKVIHDKRQAHLEGLEEEFEKNFEVKEEIIKRINNITEKTDAKHQAWQKAIKEVQTLRDAYFEAGKVPRTKNKDSWNHFKEATSTFNRKKNSFYKDQKKEQYTNLEKKRELIKIAEENKDSDDFDVVTPLMKKIQNDWKKIGYVPRKESDKVWKEFKEACNHYFDRLHAQRDEGKKEEKENLKAKEEILASMKDLAIEGNREEDLPKIKEKITAWKEIGRVPYKKRNIEQDFNKALDKAFNKLDLGKKQSELIKFENKLNTLKNRDDERKLKNEHFFISKKIDEINGEIRQLENNLGFFQHVDDDNPLVKEVHQNINKHKEQLEVWKEKLKKIKTFREKAQEEE